MANSDIAKILQKIQPDVIFHLAAQTSSIISEEHPLVDVQTNMVGALNICEAMKVLASTKLIFSSSMAVYGTYFNNNSSGPQTEPSSLYGISKLASEHIFKRLYSYQKDIQIFRLFNVYGEGQNLENLKQGMVSIYSAMALKDKHIVVKGAPNRSRDFIHVSDVVDTFIQSIESAPLVGRDIIDIGTGKEIFVSEIVELIQQYCKDLFKIDTSVAYQDGFNEDILRSVTAKPIQYNIDFESGLKQFLIWCNSELSNE